MRDPCVLLGHLRSALTLNLAEVWWVDPMPRLGDRPDSVITTWSGSIKFLPGNLYADYGLGNPRPIGNARTIEEARKILAGVRGDETRKSKKMLLTRRGRLNHSPDGPAVLPPKGSRIRDLEVRDPDTMMRPPRLILVGHVRSMMDFNLYALWWLDPTLTLIPRGVLKLFDWKKQRLEVVEPGSLWWEQRTGEWRQHPAYHNADTLEEARDYLHKQHAQEDKWYREEAGCRGKLYHKPGIPCSDPTPEIRREYERGDYKVLPRPEHARRLYAPRS